MKYSAAAATRALDSLFQVTGNFNIVIIIGILPRHNTNYGHSQCDDRSVENNENSQVR